jgi:hypothetical protein
MVVNQGAKRLGQDGPHNRADPNAFPPGQFDMVDCTANRDFEFNFMASHQYYRMSPRVRSTSSRVVLVSALWVLAGTAFALADGTLNVSLEDASEGGNLAGMKMTATPDSVKAGRITNHASNKSQALVTGSTQLARGGKDHLLFAAQSQSGMSRT